MEDKLTLELLKEVKSNARKISQKVNRKIIRVL